MTGLWRARRDGVGCDCDISLFETAMSMIMYLSTWHLSRGFEPQRMPRLRAPVVVPFQNFPTADGWIVIACAKDKFFHALAEALGLSWMSGDERFATLAARLEHRDACLELVGERLLTGRPLTGSSGCSGRACPAAPSTTSPRRAPTRRRSRAS